MGKIGFVNICHEDYIDKNVTGMAELAVKGIKQKGVEVYHCKFLASNYKSALKAGIDLAGKDLDGVILFLGAWMECTTAMAIIREIEHLPMFLWGFPMFLDGDMLNSTGSYVSYAMFKGTMKRAGYIFTDVLGMPDDERTLDIAAGFCCAASAVKQLKRTRLGLVGYTSMNIYPGTFDHLFLRTKIGPEVEQIDSYTLINKALSLPENTIKEAVEYIKSVSSVKSEVSSESLGKAAGIFAAIKQMCDERDLKGINVKCQYEFSKEYRMVACVPLSALADTGIVSSCEGDLLCTVSMMILALLTGDVVTYGDAINHIGNIIKLSSCGMLPFSMGRGERVVRNFMPHHGFSGIQASFVMRPEKITAMRLIEDCGDYHILYFTGQGRDTKLRQGYMPALDIEIDGDINTIAENYSGQHFAICYGDCSSKIEQLAKLLKIKTIRA